MTAPKPMAGNLAAVAQEISYLRACTRAIAAETAAFDLDGLMPRFGRALAALEEVLKQADEWEASSGARPLVRRSYAAEVFRAAITRELTRENGP